jgi:ABC-type dipeptide/oligopeptide/nickel transport system permease component
MRAIAIIIVILGLVSLIFGIIFITQAASAKQEVADSLTPPVTLDTLDATYDQIDAQVDQMSQTDPQYVMYFSQRTSLGLARANAGTADSVRFNGVVDICVGVGLVLAGLGLLRKVQV